MFLGIRKTFNVFSPLDKRTIPRLPIPELYYVKPGHCATVSQGRWKSNAKSVFFPFERLWQFYRAVLFNLGKCRVYGPQFPKFRSMPELAGWGVLGGEIHISQAILRSELVVLGRMPIYMKVNLSVQPNCYLNM